MENFAQFREETEMENFAQFREETERRFYKIESRISELDINVAVMQETLTERRRQADKIEDLLIEINASVNEIQTRMSGYRMSVSALIKATTIIFSLLAAMGTVIAAAWSLIEKLLKNT